MPRLSSRRACRLRRLSCRAAREGLSARRQGVLLFKFTSREWSGGRRRRARGAGQTAQDPLRVRWHGQGWRDRSARRSPRACHRAPCSIGVDGEVGGWLTHAEPTRRGGSNYGTSRTMSDVGRATHGRIHPSSFSSRLSPGHSMVCIASPVTMRQRHVRHVPLRQEFGSRTPAPSAACSNVWSSPASK